jgi:hypothetical protein
LPPLFLSRPMSNLSASPTSSAFPPYPSYPSLHSRAECSVPHTSQSSQLLFVFSSQQGVSLHKPDFQTFPASCPAWSKPEVLSIVTCPCSSRACWTQDLLPHSTPALHQYLRAFMASFPPQRCTHTHTHTATCSESWSPGQSVLNGGPSPTPPFFFSPFFLIVFNIS